MTDAPHLFRYLLQDDLNECFFCNLAFFVFVISEKSRTFVTII